MEVQRAALPSPAAQAPAATETSLRPSDSPRTLWPCLVMAQTRLLCSHCPQVLRAGPARPSVRRLPGKGSASRVGGAFFHRTVTLEMRGLHSVHVRAQLSCVLTQSVHSWKYTIRGTGHQPCLTLRDQLGDLFLEVHPGPGSSP